MKNARLMGGKKFVISKRSVQSVSFISEIRKYDLTKVPYYMYTRTRVRNTLGIYKRLRCIQWINSRLNYPKSKLARSPPADYIELNDSRVLFSSLEAAPKGNKKVRSEGNDTAAFYRRLPV